jgi:hypothetical protein
VAVGRISAWAVAAVAAAIGLSIGIGSASLEATLRPWTAGDFSPVAPRGDAALPKADVPATTHAFGTVAAGGQGSHGFVIRNTGSAPLVLSPGSSSCTCTVSDFETTGGGAAAPKTIAPGKETTVNVTWRGKGTWGPFRQHVTILTNDPARPEIALVVEGTVVPTWKALPDMITFPRVSAEEGATATAWVFTYGTEPPRIASLKAVDEATQDWFELTTAPLDAADIAAETGATGGFALTVAVRAGVPIGSLRQTVRMVFRMPEETVAELPIEGKVVGDISFAGPGWDAARHRLLLGAVSGRAGKKTTLFLTARGPRREAVKPVIVQVEPAALRVSVGAAESIGAGGVVRVPIEIAVPPGSAAANHLGSPQAPAGRITLETGLPGAAPLTIPVSVVIGP